MSSSSTVHPSVGIDFHLVRLTLGGVLLAAAAFKAFALWTDPTPSPSLFSSPRWQIASIEGETLLGLWLLSGIAPRGAWAMALIAFGLLACVSLYLGSSGQSSCGCLGKVELVPWYALGLDVVAVVALWFWRPRGFFAGSWGGGRLATRLGSSLTTGAALVVVLALATLWLVSPSLWGAIAFLRGDPLTLEPDIVDVGTGEVGTVREFSLTVHNYAARPISLVGGRATCRCIATAELPLDEPARGSRTFACEFLFQGRRADSRIHSFCTRTMTEPIPSWSPGSRGRWSHPPSPEGRR